MEMRPADAEFFVALVAIASAEAPRERNAQAMAPEGRRKLMRRNAGFFGGLRAPYRYVIYPHGTSASSGGVGYE